MPKTYGYRDWQRQQRVQQAQAKAEERQRKQDHMAAMTAEAQHRTRRLDQRIAELNGLLLNGIAQPGGVDLTALRRAATATQTAPLPTEPKREDFDRAVATGLLGAIFTSPSKRAQAQVEAQQAYDAAVAQWRARCDELRREGADRARRQAEAVREHNRRVDALIEGVRAGEPEPMHRLLVMALEQISLPPYLPGRADVAYDPRSGQALVQMQLPGKDVVPADGAYRYVAKTDEIQAVPRPAKEVAGHYRSVIAQIALLIIDRVFQASPHVTTVGFNGHVDAVDRGTGQSIHPCLISLNVTREAFGELVLDRVQPEVCLRHLNALVSPHPYDLEPIKPILEFDLSRFSFVDGMDAVSALDSRPDLMQMSHTEFEHLVRQVFEAMGFKGWTTQQSNDDGVDAVIVNPEALIGGLTIVQAKHYTKGIGVNHIRELAGAMEEKKAGRGVLVTTSWFTGPSREKAADHGRMELIDGPRLRYLIKEHLGKDVLIGIRYPRNLPSGGQATR